MEYLLVMSLSGSTMMGLYLLLKFFLKNKISAKTYYLVLKVAVLFFLVPLPFLKGWYRNIMFLFRQPDRTHRKRVLVQWTNLVVKQGEQKYLNAYAIVQIAVAAAGVLIAVILMTKLFLKYARARRLLLEYQNTEMAEQQAVLLEEVQKKYGVKRPVALYQGKCKDRTMTMGVCKPVILCGRTIEEQETRILVSHEMIHIRRLDALWKMLVRFAVILHWWNPVVRKLRSEFEQMCECSCDEIVMQGKTEEEVRGYLHLLIEEASAVPEGEAASMEWQSGFAYDAQKLRERMENLMKRKKWNRYAAAVLAAVLALGNSMTVFAYRDTLYQEVSEDMPQERVMESFRGDTFTFTPDGTEKPELQYETEIYYEKQFTDPEGNIYPYSEEETAAAYRGCSHDFVFGTATNHTKKSDGSCEVIEYRAQRCSKCGYVIKEDWICVRIDDVCLH